MQVERSKAKEVQPQKLDHPESQGRKDSTLRVFDLRERAEEYE